MPFQAPGGMAAFALEDFLLGREQKARQDRVDAMAQQRVNADIAREQRMSEYQQAEIRHGQAVLDEQRREHDLVADEKKLKDHQASVNGMMPGDVPSPEVLKFDDDHHLGNFPPNPANPNIRTYQGTHTQREAAKNEARAGAIIQQLQALQADSPERMALGAEYKRLTGQDAPGLSAKQQPMIRILRDPRVNGPNAFRVAATGQPATPEQINDRNNVVESLQDVTPKDTSAQDARRDSLFNTAHQQATAELDKWSQPIDNNLKGSVDLVHMLDTKTPVTDRLVSPLVLKTVVAGQGTGFRMTRAEIDNITHGRNRWDDLTVAIDQWAADPSKALSLSDTQRKDLAAMARAVYKRESEAKNKVIEARRKMDAARMTSDLDAVYKARTDLDEALHKYDMPDEAPDGLPAVGSTFNGGKVLRVTPIKK